MADAYVQLGRFNGMPAADAMQEARNAVRRALELAPNDPLALTTMGWVVRTADWKWREAREYFTRARAAQPGNAAAILALAVLELNLRHYEAALALAQQAVAADPLNAAAHFTLGTVYSMTDRPADAFPVYERAIALAPAAEEYRSHLSLMYARLGRHAEAEAEAKKETNPGYRLVATALSAALRGDQAAALQARAALVANHADDMAGYLTLVCTVLGDQEGSLEWMARSIARRDNGVPWAKCNLWVDRVRQRWGWDETRRDELLRRAGLADDQLN
jgi:tetratricopeptide (TPR) repeat protein